MINPLVSSILLAVMLVSGSDGGPAAGVPGPLDQQLRREVPMAMGATPDAWAMPDAAPWSSISPPSPAPSVTSTNGPTRPPTLGPDLASLGKEVSDVELVEGILEPSKAIRKGYEPITIATDDGRTINGLLVEERPDAVILRDPAQDGKSITIARGRIEQQSRGGPSIMPAGLVNSLGSRQQFLDLLRYLMEIAEHGPARARALRPDPALVSPPLPDYERRLDHAGMIAGLGPKNFQRGEAIYGRVCANCHGTKDQPGSLPTAPRFATAALKNGSDPYTLYRTITDGFGQMAPQTWMVPRQKYDVIHYIREEYLKAGGRVDMPPSIGRTWTGCPRGPRRAPRPPRSSPGSRWITGRA